MEAPDGESGHGSSVFDDIPYRILTMNYKFPRTANIWTSSMSEALLLGSGGARGGGGGKLFLRLRMG